MSLTWDAPALEALSRAIGKSISAEPAAVSSSTIHLPPPESEPVLLLLEDAARLAECRKNFFSLYENAPMACLSARAADRARALGARRAGFVGPLVPPGFRFSPRKPGNTGPLRVGIAEEHIVATALSRAAGEKVELAFDGEIDLFLDPSDEEVACFPAWQAVTAGIPVLAWATVFTEGTIPESFLFRNLSEALAKLLHAAKHGPAPAMPLATRFDLSAWSGLLAAREREPSAFASEGTHGGPAGPFRCAAKIALGRWSRAIRPAKPTITLWGEMKKGPYGGGSQVFKAIAGELRRRGYRVLNNSAFPADGHILNSAWFDRVLCERVVFSGPHRPKVVHRIDGPISLYRQVDIGIDSTVFELNQRVATSTAFQCYYSWSKSLELGLKPVNPVIIRNACDPELFHPSGMRPTAKKLRLISSSWSTNKLKGFDVYEYLDKNLDFSRFEYTFVGRSPVSFRNIRMVDALPSRELGRLLREHDVFVFASHNDAASNALLEAITTGLPSLYADTGGSSEFAGPSSRPFRRAEEVPSILEEVREHYELYRGSYRAKAIGEVVEQYLRELELPLTL